MPLLNKEQILERGWTEEVFESLTQNKGQVVKSGENFWHLNSVEKMEKSEKFKNFNLGTTNENEEPQDIVVNQDSKPKVKTTLLTKEQILQRGWSEDEIEKFLSDTYVQTKEQKLWHVANIKKVENQIDFIFFKKTEEFNELTETGKNFTQSLNIDFNQGNHLISKLKNYDSSKSIYHLVKENFAPDENGSYSLFTDGSFKTVDKKSFASCGGWIVDNNTKEVIMEFSKPLELDDSQKRGQPNFELMGIAEGVKIIKQLGLKNVQIYTDSFEESRRIFLALNGKETEYYKDNEELFNPILNTLKNSNSTIAWIPREYNLQADKLAEISLNAWEKQNAGGYKDKDYIAEHGYKVDRDKSIYFHQDKAYFKEHKESTNQYTIVIVDRSENKKRYLVSLIHDNVTHRLTILESLPRDYSYIDENLPEQIKKIKKSKPDGVLLMNLARAINNSKDLGDINICVSDLVIAVNNKVTPIPSDLQEEFFEFHKALNNYPGKITMTTKWKKLDEKIKGYLQVVEEKHFDETSVPKKVKPR
jgi:ribonuclease HI